MTDTRQGAKTEQRDRLTDIADQYTLCAERMERRNKGAKHIYSILLSILAGETTKPWSQSSHQKCLIGAVTSSQTHVDL